MVSLLETADGRFVGAGADELDRLFDRLAGAAQPKLILHVHGGLVDDDVARRHAYWLDGNAGYGPLKAHGWEPSYLIWRTGLLQTIRINLHELAGDALFSAIKAILRRWIARKALDMAGLADGLVSNSISLADLEDAYRRAEFLAPPAIAANLTASEAAVVEGDAEPGPGDELYDALASDPELQDIARKMELTMARQGSPGVALQPADEAALSILARLDPEVREELAVHYAARPALMGSSLLVPIFLRAARAGYRVIKRALTGRDHGFVATVVEEIARELYLDLIGSGIWGAMKQDAADHFESGAAGTELLTRLERLARDADRPVRLLFVGHSAGCVLACELLARTGPLPDNVIVDFVFLAPAVRMDRAAAVLGAARSRLGNLRIFTMKDEREKEDALDGVLPVTIYPRSLLYLISGALERDESGDSWVDAPLLGLQRHLTGLPDEHLTRAERAARAAIATLLDAAPARVVFSGSNAGDGLNTQSRSHGGFDEDPPTLASIRHIAMRGFAAGRADA